MKLPGEFYTLINGIWPILCIFVVSLITIRLSYLVERHQKFVLYKEFFSLVFIIYILLLFELVTNTDVQGVSNNFIPFKEILRYEIGSKYFIWNVIGNIAIFIPFGFAVSLYLKSKKLAKPFFIALVTSTTIECVQMFIGRSFDIDDIILNLIGGIIGYFIYSLLAYIEKHLPPALRRPLIYNILTLLLIAVIIVYCFQYGGLLFG